MRAHALVALLSCLVALDAHADEARIAASAGSDALAGLVPTAGEEERAREAALAHALDAMLARLDGVSEAHSVVDLPSTACAPLDRPLPRGSASVVLALPTGSAGPSDEQVRGIVQGAARELDQARVEITRTHRQAASPSASLVSIGPFRVARESAASLRTLLGLSLAANVALATFLLARLRRRAP